MFRSKMQQPILLGIFLSLAFLSINAQRSHDSDGRDVLAFAAPTPAHTPDTTVIIELEKSTRPTALTTAATSTTQSTTQAAVVEISTSTALPPVVQESTEPELTTVQESEQAQTTTEPVVSVNPASTTTVGTPTTTEVLGADVADPTGSDQVSSVNKINVDKFVTQTTLAPLEQTVSTVVDDATTTSLTTTKRDRTLGSPVYILNGPTTKPELDVKLLANETQGNNTAEVQGLRPDNSTGIDPEAQTSGATIAWIVLTVGVAVVGLVVLGMWMFRARRNRKRYEPRGYGVANQIEEAEGMNRPLRNTAV